MELLFYNVGLYFWAVGVNNQLLGALSSISEASTDSSDAVVAIWRHDLSATEGYTKGAQFCFLAFVSEKLKFCGEPQVADGEPAKSNSLEVLPPWSSVNG